MKSTGESNSTLNDNANDHWFWVRLPVISEVGTAATSDGVIRASTVAVVILVVMFMPSLTFCLCFVVMVLLFLALV
jgi:hypothetical protein